MSRRYANYVYHHDCKHAAIGVSVRTDMSATADSLSAKLSRKRTKTGCLTCRRRRIKCGEERPTCRNCIKSKRQCEGYAQRVVFKTNALWQYQNVGGGAAHITFNSQPLDEGPFTYQPGYQINSVDATHAAGPQQHANHFHPGYSQLAHHNGQVPQTQTPPMQAIHQSPTPNLAPGFHAQFIHPQQGFVGDPPVTYQHLPPQYAATTHPPTTTAAFTAPVEYTSQSMQPVAPTPILANGQTVWQPQQVPIQDQKWHQSSPTTSVTLDKVSPTSAHSSNTIQWNAAPPSNTLPPTWPPGTYAPQHQPGYQLENQAYPQYQQAHEQFQQSRNASMASANHQMPDFYEHVQQQFDTSRPADFLAQAAVETQDDDYYDVEPDEEMANETSLLSSIDQERQQTLHTILQMSNISIQDLHTRRYDTFIYDGIMTHYNPEEVASPLRNPATARVFAHFISVTGPSLSIYERHPLNTSVLFTPGEIPFSQQGLWTYTMPMAALHHRGLLHAMLALASLHIARLQNADETPSLKHYMWSSKRIHNCVANEKKRFKPTTIAATMLLGFYEIMTADHTKWNMHLAGSKQLFLETDFVTMSRQFRRLKKDRLFRVQGGEDTNNVSPQLRARDEILDQICDVDERVVSDFAGKEVRYDDYGHIVTQKNQIPRELDLGQFEILRDLYWWYLKQDAYQSMISGNPLLLEYDKWTNCPPRAPLGRLDAIYGTFDHLMLLLGRIADFAARDRVRKLKQMDANGGNWIPPAWMRMGPPDGHQPPATPVSASGPQATNRPGFPPAQAPSAPPPMPQFFGMAPPPRDNVRMPASYMPRNNIPTPDTASPKDFIDLAAAKEAAMADYGRIRAALHAFEKSLGDGFHPYSADYYPPLETPFGFSLQYRSYDIGCLWAIYHMAVIIAIRSQPDMHPAAHVAAAICATETHHHAQLIGQITAGIVIPAEHQPLNPTLGSSLCESCMPLFFAAIQYQDPAQRHQTITRIYDIAQRTGWGSAELIAHGCETAWVKAAQAGRGPPYDRVLRHASALKEAAAPKQKQQQQPDPRKTGSWETDNPNSGPDHGNHLDRRFVTVQPNARLNWAIGIMGTEDDERLIALQ